ncbi:hypothetical protein PDQ74_04895 [Bacillus cereus group sp. Bc005]|uniref:hypothetical protein n=1 Tax=Bacillus cereus group TaxID=86661 RepID=UPI001F15AA4D|nr:MULTISPECIES: hypothetical protein [Bacillus cereus group]MDA2756316.1 hypothetical protein [Bacillus cereus group sp. Bc007]MDA2761719.1 hypothetical protein [Bacillus cereus group sp. Bc008]MDA2773114.1 hypothetical protein [Bacillus cereus group sp. Bc005]BCC55132.1 hypothetical protein BCJMU07_4482 [Bacillus cereus]
MKEFKVNMTKRVSELASNPIRTKNHVIMLLLEAIPLLTYGEIEERTDANQIILRIDKMKRLFFVLDEKIFSFNFPFSVEIVTEQSNPIIYDSITNLEISGINLAILKSAFEEIFFEKESQGVLDLETELLHIMDSFEMKPNKDQIWEILKKLLVFESGYLRYDYDEIHENGKLHPLNHLDINYSSDSTFKIGISNKISSDTFIDILDINTNCYFLSK